VGAGVGYALARWDRRALVLTILCIALNWLGDSLDGTLARVRRQQRPRYGFYVDHMVDIFGSAALMGGLACSGLVHWQIAVAMLVAFLLLSGESYLATYTLERFELSQGWFGPTELRILLVVGNLALLRSPWAAVFGHRFL
jgi:phosphatidylglycerophosphate synthase